MAQEFVRSRHLLDREGPMGDLTRRERKKWHQALMETSESDLWTTQGNDDVVVNKGFDDAKRASDVETAEQLAEIEAILNEADQPRHLPAPQEAVREANRVNHWARAQNVFKVNQWPVRMWHSYTKIARTAHDGGIRKRVREALLEQDVWASFLILWFLFLIIVCLVRYILL